MRLFLLSLLWLPSAFLSAQPVRAYVDQQAPRILEEYIRFVSIPNVSTDTPNIRRNTAFIRDMMAARGLKAELLEGTTPGVTPAVYAEVRTPGARRTLGFYAHYDGQPVNPAQWHPGLQPFSPVLLSGPLESGGTILGPYQKGKPLLPEYRLSGRGAADDKAGVMAILNAYEALKATGARLNANLIFLFEGEEEVGSIHLDEIFRRHAGRLKADAWIIVDGPRHISGRKTVSFGVRGDVNVNLTVFGPRRPLHSGNYGNWAPSPAFRLVELLASMKDDSGRVTIPGFYDDVTPLSPTEVTALEALPQVDETLKKELGLAAEEMPGVSLARALMMPTLNINGIRSGNTGALAANVIPTTAEAVLDLRLVKGNDWKRQVQKVTDYIRGQGYLVLDRAPTDDERLRHPRIIRIDVEHGYNAQRTSMDLPISGLVRSAVQATTKEPLVLIPASGGSLPLYLFEELLQAPVITIPIVNYDNNQHAENENVRLSYLWEGIETIAAVMMASK